MTHTVTHTRKCAEGAKKERKGSSAIYQMAFATFNAQYAYSFIFESPKWNLKLFYHLVHRFFPLKEVLIVWILFVKLQLLKDFPRRFSAYTPTPASKTY